MSNAAVASLLFGVGVGAILQVIVQITPALRDQTGKLLSLPVLGGLSAGVVIMCASGLLVSV